MAHRFWAAAACALTVLPGTVVISTPTASATGGICYGVGRRIHVSSCTDPVAPPPAEYAPLPEDMPPPPPPPPNQPCVDYRGRWIHTNNCP